MWPRIVKNIASLSSANFVVAGGVFGLNILVARTLGPQEFGQYSLAFAFVGVFTVFSHLGLDILVTRDVARDRSEAAKALGAGLVLSLALALLALVVITSAVSLLRYSPSTKLVVVIVATALLPASLTLLCRAIFRAFQRMELELVVAFLSTAFFVGGGVAVLALGGGVAMVVAVYPLANLVAFGGAFALVRAYLVRPHFAWDARLFRYLLVTTIPFALNGLLLPIYSRVDVVVVGTLEGESAVGLYSAAYTFVAPLAILSPSIARAVFPALSHAFISSQRFYQELLVAPVTASLALLIPFGLGVSFFAEPILSLVFGSSYGEAAVVLQILIWAGILTFLNTLLINALEASDRQVRATLFLAAGASTNCLLSLVLVSLVGYAGAAVATLATQVIVFLLVLRFGQAFSGRESLALGEPVGTEGAVQL